MQVNKIIVLTIALMSLFIIGLGIGVMTFSHKIFAEPIKFRYEDGYNYGNLDGNTLAGNMEIINGSEFLKHTTAWQNGFIAATDHFFNQKLPYYDYDDNTLNNIPQWLSNIVSIKQ